MKKITIIPLTSSKTNLCPIAGLLPKGVLSPQFKAVFKAPISTKQILVVTLKHPFYLNSPRTHPLFHSLSQLIVTVSHVQPTPFPPSITTPLILHAFSSYSASQHLFSNYHLEFSAPGRKIVKFMGAWCSRKRHSQWLDYLLPPQRLCVPGEAFTITTKKSAIPSTLITHLHLQYTL